MSQQTTPLVFDDESGTVTDSNTGLMWMLPIVGQGWSHGTAQGEGVKLSWDMAASQYGRARNIFAHALNCHWKDSFSRKHPLNQETYSNYKFGNKQFDFAGFRDWRLPTVEEFWSLSQAGAGDSPLVGWPHQMWTANSTTRSLKGFFFTFDLGGHCAWLFALHGGD